MVTSLYSDLNIWVRNSRDGDAFTSWKALLHSGNYTSYSPSLTGSGASGTWAINISGNSATTAGCTFSNDSTDKDNITTRTDSGFWQSSSGTTAEGWPRNDNSWQHLISCTHSNDGNYYAMQLSASFFSQNLYYRSTNGNGSTGWSEVLTSSSYSSYALPLSGGTLTGTTYFSGANGGLQANYNGGVSFYGNEINSGANGVTGSLYLGQRNTNEVYVKGNVAIHAGNYGSYALPLSGGTVSGDLRLGSRLGFTGSGNAGDGFPYARFVEAYGIQFQSPSTVWTLSTSGSFLAGMNSAGANFGTGNIVATGNVTAYYSDERLKTNLGRIERALEKVRSLEGFRYVENELARSFGYTTKEPQLGVSAQAVQRIAPEVVSLAPFDMTGDGKVDGDGKIYSKSGENYLTVDYSRLVPLLIEAVKELADMVEELR